MNDIRVTLKLSIFAKEYRAAPSAMRDLYASGTDRRAKRLLRRGGDHGAGDTAFLAESAWFELPRNQLSPLALTPADCHRSGRDIVIRVNMAVPSVRSRIAHRNLRNVETEPEAARAVISRH